jgi:molybdate transport system substrate-binding protein
MATRALLGDLVDAFAHATGRRVALESVGGVEAAKRVASGEVFDVVVLAREAIAKLTATGHLIAATQVDFVRSRVAAAIRAGTTRPTLDTVSAVQRALRAATSVGYSTGPSGTALAALFHAWGLTEALAGRTVIAPPGVPVATLVARGEVELGFQQLSELIDVPGVEILRELPPELEVVTTFSAAISVRSSAPDAARAWIDFLSSPAARTSMRRHGMEPA